MKEVYTFTLHCSITWQRKLSRSNLLNFSNIWSQHLKLLLLDCAMMVAASCFLLSWKQLLSQLTICYFITKQIIIYNTLLDYQNISISQKNSRIAQLFCQLCSSFVSQQTSRGVHLSNFISDKENDG